MAILKIGAVTRKYTVAYAQRARVNNGATRTGRLHPVLDKGAIREGSCAAVYDCATTVTSRVTGEVAVVDCEHAAIPDSSSRSHVAVVSERRVNNGRVAAVDNSA